ncbi:MAG: PP2C family protein-serine/threonine phosphatase [Devosia sp.]
MLLRSRITVFLTVALILVIGGLAALGVLRSQLEQDRLAEIAIDGQRSLWKSMVAANARDLSTVAGELAVRLSIAAPQMTRDEIADVAADSPDLLTAGRSVQVINLSGQLLFANQANIRGRPLFGIKSINALLDGRAFVGGLRQESPDRYVIGAARLVEVRGEPTAVVAIAEDAKDVLAAFSQTMEEPAYLVSLRGQMVEGTDPALYDSVSPDLPARSESTEVITQGERFILAVGAPVDDLISGAAGTLVTLRDSTQSLSARRLVERVGFFVPIGVALIITLGLYLYLRQAFRPLEGAISVLDGLSKGNTHVALDSAAGSGEIKRIAEAVTVFRRNALLLSEQGEAIERQRRRQERVIRRQLQRLAETLDDQGRDQVLADLDTAMEGSAHTGGRRSKADSELSMLAAVLEGMSARITDQHHRLTQLIKDLQDSIVTRERLAGLEQELEIARELQLSFMPRPLPAHVSYAIQGRMQAAKEVGGDFFDYFMIDAHRLGFVVADVSGKGVPAALFMAISRTLIKATALTTQSPAKTVSDVNTFLAADNEQMMFVTLFHGVLDCRTGALTYVNAGHNPPYLVPAATGVPEPLPRFGDPALAIAEDLEFTEHTIALEPRDLIFLFTDGVTEAFNVAGDAYGEGRLVALLAKLKEAATVEEISGSVVDEVLAFEVGADRADDTTCVALRYLGPDSA